MHAWVSPYLADVKKVMGGGGEEWREREKEKCVIKKNTRMKDNW